MNLSQIIKDRRLLLGLTQQDLADYTELSLRIIKSIEAGNGNPTFSTLNKIAEILGLEIIMQVKEVNKRDRQKYIQTNVWPES